MLFAAGAAASALDALISPLLQSKKTSGTSANSGTGFSASSSSVGDQSSSQILSGDAIKGSSGPSSSISPQTMSALISAQSDNTGATTTAKPKDPLADLFALLDGDGDGKVSKSEFENALGAGGTNLKNADSVFAKLDTDGDGTVSVDELGAALKGKGHHHAHEAGGAGDGGGDSAQASKGATATTKTNADGSITTTLTYDDGSKVTSTSAAGGSKSASINMLEKLIQQQAQMISSASTAAGSSLSVSA